MTVRKGHFSRLVRDAGSQPARCAALGYDELALESVRRASLTLWVAASSNRQWQLRLREGGGTMGTSSEPGDDRAGPGLDAVMGERRQLVNLTYRLLGSLAEAEDAVQETYARWFALSPKRRVTIESPGAWLSKVAGRICLDMLGSARARRERYRGQWLPEPLDDPSEWRHGLAGGTADPADRVTLDESVSMAFLVVLEAMTPAERVRVHPPRRLRVRLRGRGRGHGPDSDGLPPASFLGPPARSRHATRVGPGSPPGPGREGLQTGLGGG